MENHKFFHVNQNAVLQKSDGTVLILRQDGKWMLPGGRLEDGETWEEGLRREVREETGIDDFVIERILFVDLSESGNTYVVTFLCKSDSDPRVIISSEHQEFAWFTGINAQDYTFWYEKIKVRLIKIIEDEQKGS